MLVAVPNSALDYHLTQIAQIEMVRVNWIAEYKAVPAMVAPHLMKVAEGLPFVAVGAENWNLRHQPDGALMARKVRMEHFGNYLWELSGTLVAVAVVEYSCFPLFVVDTVIVVGLEIRAPDLGAVEA